MENIKLNINKMTISVVSKPEGLTLNKGAVLADFDFSEEWVGVKTALFLSGETTYSVLINEDNTCEIPQQCYSPKEKSFSIGCICGDLITTNSVRVLYNESCYVTDVSIPEPPTNVYTQIIEKINDIDSGGVTEHNLLTEESRNLPNQHSIGSITNLQETLNSIVVTGGGVIEHNLLTEESRNLPNQHSIEAITDLQEELDSKMPTTATGEDIKAYKDDTVTIAEVFGSLADVTNGVVGRVDTIEELPTENVENGDVYIVGDIQNESILYQYIWSSSAQMWFPIGKNAYDTALVNTNPIGEIISYMGTVAPKNYLICDGTVYNITEYQMLADQIHDNFGTYNYFGGDGITTFAVPDMRGLFTRGFGGASGEIGVKQDATKMLALSAGSTDAFISFGRANTNANDFTYNNADELIDGPSTGYRVISATTSGSTSFVRQMTTRPDNMAVLYCIKYSMGDDLTVNGVGINEVGNIALDSAVIPYDDENSVSDAIKKLESNKSSFKFFVDGGQTNWIAEDTSTCYFPKDTNEFNNIPAKYEEFENIANSHSANYYGTITDDLEGVELAADICLKAKKIDFTANIFGQSQTWYNTSFRLIIHAPTVTESEYKSKYLNNNNIIVLLSGDLGAGNSQRNATVSGESLPTSLKSASGELKDVNGWILRFQLITDNTQDYISDLSRITITFTDM